MPLSLSDTDPRIERMIIERQRQMSPARKLCLMNQLNQMARDLALSDIRRQHPHASDVDLRYYLAERNFGSELAEKVYGKPSDAAG